MSELLNYYNEHASQARQHEDHRERMTNIILSINGVLIGLITFSNLSLWSVCASGSIVLLGIYGFFFAGKHYERFKFHTSIMGAIRSEIDRLYLDPHAKKRALWELRDEGASNHFKNFTWHVYRREKDKDGKGKAGRDLARPKIVKQYQARSWIARQRVHVFWEFIHILMILIGLALTSTILIKNNRDSSEKPLRIEIVNPEK
jgi:hypothetical protein